jgi:hypothetical protein
MKVALHVGQVTQPIPGGIGRYTKSLIKALPKDEITLYTFACSEPKLDAPPRYKESQIKFSSRIVSPRDIDVK